MRVGCMMILCNLTVDSVVGEILPITDRTNGGKYYHIQRTYSNQQALD